MTLFQSFRDYLSRRYPSAQMNVEPDSRIGFSIDGLNYIYIYDSQDPHYFRLLLPRVAIREGINPADVYRIACEVSSEYKVGKIVVIANDFWICFEQIIVDVDANNDTVYDMSIRVLSTLIRVFRERVNSFSVG